MNYDILYAPMLEEYELTVFPYSALASGFLTGKYRSEADFGKSVRGQGDAKYLNEQGLNVLQALDNISEEHHTVPAAVALAWLSAQRNVGGALASATSLEQLKQILSATSLVLDEEDLELLDAVSKYKQ